MLLEPCYQHCAQSSVLLRGFSTTWFNSGEFTLFWRKSQNVAKYAFLVLLFWAKIFICAIFYAYSISASKYLKVPRSTSMYLEISQSTSKYPSVIRAQVSSIKDWQQGCSVPPPCHLFSNISLLAPFLPHHPPTAEEG